MFQWREHSPSPTMDPGDTGLAWGSRLDWLGLPGHHQRIPQNLTPQPDHLVTFGASDTTYSIPVICRLHVDLKGQDQSLPTVSWATP